MRYLSLACLLALSVVVSGSPLPSGNSSLTSPHPVQKRCRPRPPTNLMQTKVRPSGLTGNFTGMKEINFIHAGQPKGGWASAGGDGPGGGHGWGPGNHGHGWGGQSKTGQNTGTDQPPPHTQATQPTQTTQTQSQGGGQATQSQTSPDPTTSQGSSGGGSADGAKAMVQLHNDFRAKHGAGPVVWSDELANYATNYADKCKFEHSGGPYGENLIASSGKMDAAQGFQGWADEASDYDPNNPQYSHFTQVVWKATNTIGCTIVDCGAGTIFDSASVYIICEYQPPGNVIGQFAQNVQ